MFSAQAESALSLLLESLAARPSLEDAIRARWRPGGRDVVPAGSEGDLSRELCAAIDQLGEALPVPTRAEGDITSLATRLAATEGALLFTLLAASTWRRDAEMAPLLAIAAAQPELRARAAAVAR